MAGIRKNQTTFSKNPLNVRRRLHRKENPEHWINLYLVWKYGVTLQWVKRKGRRGCEICGAKTTKDGRLHVDHNHKTNKVRGVLCGLCNRLLGHCGDSIITLQKAIKYLKKYEPST